MKFFFYVYEGRYEDSLGRKVFKIGQTRDLKATENRYGTIGLTRVDIREIESDNLIGCNVVFAKKHITVNKRLADDFLHDIIVSQGYRQIRDKKKGRENFDFPNMTHLEVAKVFQDAINTLVHCNFDLDKAIKMAPRESFTPREEQVEAITKASSYFRDGGDEFVLNAKMRFGKTYTAYKIANEINAKRVLVLTFKPSISGEWANGLRHVDFPDWQFHHALNFSATDPIKYDVNIPTVLFGSFQDILGVEVKIKDIDEEYVIKQKIKKKWNWVIKQHFDLIIIDEVHYGFKREKAQELVSSLNYDKLLLLSGTPFKILYSGEYFPEQIYTWSYYEEQEKRNKELQSDWKTDIYKWLPKMNLYTVQLGEEALKLMNRDLYEKKEFPTPDKFFGAESSEKFVYQSAVEKWLDNLAEDKRVYSSPFNLEETAGKLRHMLWFLGSVNSCKAMRKTLEKHPFFSKFTSVVASGDNDGEGNDTLGLVNHRIHMNPLGTITLSCGKLNTGVTIPEWSGVFMLSNTVSPETYWQTAFRCQSPNKKDNKLECWLFDIDPDRTFKMVYTYCEASGKDGESTVTSIGRFLDTMDIYSLVDNKIVKVHDVAEIISRGLNTDLAIKHFTSPKVVNYCNLTDKVRDILKGLPLLDGKKVQDIEFTNSDVGKGKNKKTGKRIGGDTKEKTEQSPLEVYILRALAISNKLPNFMRMTDEEEKSLQDIFDVNDEEYKAMFQQYTQISIEQFKALLDEGFINYEKLDRAIQSYWLAVHSSVANN